MLGFTVSVDVSRPDLCVVLCCVSPCVRANSVPVCCTEVHASQ